MTRFTTTAQPFPTRTADPRCLHCFGAIYQSSDGAWRHGSTGSARCQVNGKAEHAARVPEAGR